jgi:hypothetical protein
MEQNKKPVDKFFYSEKEWDRLGCGPLPKERNLSQQKADIIARASPWTDGKTIKGSN